MPRFILYGGKGGVGKTTCAAATALKLSRMGKKTLVVSTDPAHSLSDSFGTDIGSEPTEVTDYLWGVETDPEESMDEYREELSGDSPGMDGLGLGLDQINDELGETMGGLFDDALMAPGSDEAAAIYQLMEYMESDEYDYIVFDTAPTGHTLRLLQLPEVMDSMVGRIMKIRNQVKGVIGSFKSMLGGEDSKGFDQESLERFKERIEDIREQLRDPDKTDFRVVLTPERMAILETQRLIEQLTRFEIPVRTVVINRVMKDINPDCEFCQSRHEVQQENLQEAAHMFRDLDIQQVPLMEGEVRGIDSLEKVADSLELDI